MRQGKRINRIVISLFVVTLVTAICVPNVTAYYTRADSPDRAVHEYIAEQAAYLYGDKHPNWISFSNLYSIIDGAGDEDWTDHIYKIIGAFKTYPHLWDADKGPDAKIEGWFGTAVWGYPDGYPNSWEKAQELWKRAIDNYKTGNYPQAYEYLGHVAHLLADQSVPAHAHADPHPFKDLYEYNFMTLQEAQLGTVSYGDAASEQKHLHDMGPVIIPPPPNTDLCNKYKNSPNNLYGLYYLFYTQNQIGDFFPSNNDEPSDGDMIDNYGGWMSRVYSELGMDSNTRPRKIVDLDNNKNGYDGDGDLSRIRHYSYLYSIRSVAALYQLFEETVKDTASHGYKVTVTTGKVDGAGTDSDVYMKLIGTKGNTVPQLLDKPGYNDFEKGDSDVYTIVSPYDIGDISGVVITFSPKDAGPGWYLDNFVVEDIKGKKWTFPYMDWITIAGDYPLTAIGTTYSVAVRTGDVDNAGTDSDITINLVGDKGPTGPKYLDTPNYDDFERKAVNTFSFTAPSVGDIKYIIITASPKGSGPDWWLDFIVVTDTRTKKMWTFMWNKWIQSGGYSIPLYSTSGG